ncbi:cadherin-related family member 2-like isoform X3 [Scyliorhinus canicula]|uniref:cadherin-related family member 2-like isoform X3 n=1 Tax=Scyliorhinus canicula TaxID=7830 RepID=UPI0018F52256|nr:cadherin-related family member 2-like isoform X3 [Scyliorhinus canicula]
MVTEQMKILQCLCGICIILVAENSTLGWSQNLAPTFLTNMTVVRITEDAPRGTSVFRIAADDKDGDLLSYGLEGELALFYFTVNSSSGDVTVKEAVDREVKKTLHIYVEDVNDNAPAFKGLPYRADVAEQNENVGTEIFRVFAGDIDRGKNGSVNYEILELIPSENAVLFEISKNGSVYLKGQLDFSTNSIYQLLIKALDQGEPEAKYSTTRLIVNVIDVPNKPPEFLQSFYHVRVPENLPVNTDIITVTAVDGDRGINNPVRYSINGSGAFTVDNVTGRISAVSLLDREQMSELITINITASELVKGVKDRSATTTAAITILILDVNDNAPIFYTEQIVATDAFHVTVPEETANNVPILHILVQDLDQGNNGTFEVFLLGADSTAFNLNQNIVYNEGILLLQVANSEALDFEKNHVFQFQLFAVEMETQEMFSSVAVVRVDITDRNDNSPVFDQDYFILEVPEDSTNGYNVTCITATDADSANFGKITYRLLGSDSVLQTFDVDPQLGTFFVKNETFLDREKRQQLFVTLQAKDGGGLSTNVQIEVSISDANDEVPVFQQNSYTGFIKENVIKNIVQVQAFDKDQEDSPNSQVTYRIIDGDPAEYFTINSSTGIISVVEPLDRESMDASSSGIINLTVQAKDCGNPAQSSTTQVIIKVEDVNDNEPVFNQSTFFVAVPEDWLDQCVVSIWATDNDATDPNHLISYRIEDGARGQFILSTEQGDLHQSAACIHVNPESRLDYDGGPRKYKLTVAANDFGFDPNTGCTMIEVDILDVNDEAPVLIGSSLSDVFARENGRINTTVAVIQAFDADTDAELHFFIRGTECLDDKRERLSTSLCKNWFQVMERSGSLFYAGPVDRESVQAVQLRVQVVDYNTVLSSDMSEEGHIKVIIADENDNPPVFTRTENKYVVVSELITEGLEITMFEATDCDVGKNGIITFRVVEVTFSPADAPSLNRTAEESFYIQTSLNSNYRWEGSLRIRNYLHFTRKGSWKVKVAAIDGGFPNNTVHHLLEVFVVDGSSKLQLAFDSPPGSVLLNEKEILSILEAVVPGTDVIVSKISPAIKNTSLRGTLMDVYFICGNGTAVDPDVVRGWPKIVWHDLKKTTRILLRVLVNVHPSINKTETAFPLLPLPLLLDRALFLAELGEGKILEISWQMLEVEQACPLVAVFGVSGLPVLQMGTKEDVLAFVSPIAWRQMEQNVSVLSGLIDTGLITVGSRSSHLQSDNKDVLYGVIFILVATNIISITVAAFVPVCIRQRYQRKLKAALALSATVLTSVRSNPMISVAPGTNMHASEGSNPVWNRALFSEATCHFNAEACLDQKSLNSIDDNVIADEKDYFNIRKPGIYKRQDKREKGARERDVKNSQDFLTAALASREGYVNVLVYWTSRHEELPIYFTDTHPAGMWVGSCAWIGKIKF